VLDATSARGMAEVRQAVARRRSGHDAIRKLPAASKREFIEEQLAELPQAPAALA
jgi:hypothetical protein